MELIKLGIMDADRIAPLPPSKQVGRVDEKENTPGEGIGNMNSPCAGKLLLTGEFFLKKARDYDMIGVGRPMGAYQKTFDFLKDRAYEKKIT